MEAIAILDFGSQFAHLISNRVRRLGVYSDVFIPETPLPKLKKYKGIILSGGPQSVYDKGAPTVSRKIFSLGIPVLGMCYGHQLIAHVFGGRVVPGKTKEYGLAELTVLKKSGIFSGVPARSTVWMSHGDTIEQLPKGFATYAKTEDCEHAAIGNAEKKIFSAQYHVEVAHTEYGMKMLSNFLKLCEVKRTWSTELFLKRKMNELKAAVGSRNVFLMASGGVDSTVAYVLLAKALGANRVHGLFVDTGLLRKDEGKHIIAALGKIGVKNFHVEHAEKKFLAALKGVTLPEEKRKIIGDLFLKVQADAVKNLKLNPKEWVLGQGTIYPDTIESAGTKYADKIKTHHNRVPEILKLIKEGKVIEPLAELYKDEVRELGAQLGLPPDMVWKHPFPGPGLAVRILCAQKEMLPKETPQLEEELERYLLPHKLSAKILPIQSVGVQGDARTYRNPLAIWSHGGSADFTRLEAVSTALTNRCAAINRVCLLLSPQKLHAAKLMPATLTERRVKLLQTLDDIVMSWVKKHKLAREMWQFPTVLAPLSINGIKKEAVILRPVCSEEAMTANFYKMDGKILKGLVSKLQPHVSAVFYDVTNKPPGTIEWE